MGDSVANTVLGYENTLSVTISDMAHHVAAVARARPKALVVGDMPWMSYHTSADEAVCNAATLIRAGAGAVKLEGGARRVPVIEAIVGAEIPVMGHLGLTPQSVHVMGGYRVQARRRKPSRRWLGRRGDRARRLLRDRSRGGARRGGAMVTDRVDVPTIGIGAGASCDGQVLVAHDLLGFGDASARQVRAALRRPEGRHRRRRSQSGPGTSEAAPFRRTPRPTTCLRLHPRAEPDGAEPDAGLDRTSTAADGKASPSAKVTRPTWRKRPVRFAR